MASDTDVKARVTWRNFRSYRKFMEGEARRLRWTTAPEGPPYCPLRIAGALGVEVREAPLHGLDGYLESEDERWRAVISTVPSRERQRFTLAHELGHFVLMKAAEAGYGRDLMRYRVAGFSPQVHQDPVEERLCNVFAAELLVPTSELLPRVKMGLDLPREIPELAKDFDVSLQAAAGGVVRALGEDHCAFAMWKFASPLPLRLWWIGMKTSLRRELNSIEAFGRSAAQRGTDSSVRWNSFNGRSLPVRIKASPTSTGRYAFLFAEVLMGNLPEELPGSWRA